MEKRDLRSVLEALNELAQTGHVYHAAQAALTAAAACVGADSAVITRLDESGATAWVWPPEFLDERQWNIFETVNNAHPWPLATHTRQGPGAALRISDLLSLRQYRSTPIYSELFHELAIRHQVAFSLPTLAHHSLCVALQRDRRDFTSMECDDLNALRPCLATAAQRPGPGVTGEQMSAFEALTPRERAILQLAATGLSDLQIGQRLEVSKYTVSKHLQHLYQKTGLTNRTQAARWARTFEASPAATDVFVAGAQPPAVHDVVRLASSELYRSVDATVTWH